MPGVVGSRCRRIVWCSDARGQSGGSEQSWAVPDGYVIELSKEELADLRSKFLTLLWLNKEET